MEKENSSQLELFSRSKDYSNFKIQAPQYTFFGRIRNYEKTILVIFAFAVTVIISFSLGVEKGKRTQLVNTGSRVDMALKTQPQASSKTTPDAAVDKQPSEAITTGINTLVNVNIKKRIQLAQEKQDNTKQSTYPQDLNNYTVQVASFKSGPLARKETERLKKMGFKALTFPSGKFIVVCVGSFSDKKKAEPTKSELKKRYGDCLIRRL